MSAIGERIKDAHLNVWMSVQRDDLLVPGHCGPIVDAHPHPHSAISGVQQSVGEESASFVAANDEVLQV
jgi:hypothetical protein